MSHYYSSKYCHNCIDIEIIKLKLMNTKSIVCNNLYRFLEGRGRCNQCKKVFEVKNLIRIMYEIHPYE